MTYLVMENHLSYSVVLDEAGRFLRVANLCYDIGQTVDRVIPLKEKKALPKTRIAGAAGGIAACLILTFSMYWYSFLTPFGSVYLSVNPDVRMDVSRKDTVVSLAGLNGDGKLLIQDYKYRGKELEVVTDELMDRAIAMGYLSDGDTITIEINAPSEEWFIQEGIALRKNLGAYLDDKVEVTVIIQKGQVKTESQPSAPADTPVSGNHTGDSEYGDDDASEGNSGYVDADDENGNSEYAPPVSEPLDIQPPPSIDQDSGYDNGSDDGDDSDDGADSDDSNISDDD